MILANPVIEKLVKFYGSSMLHKQDKKVITDQSSKAYQEGREARLKGCGINENPYNKEDADAIWSRYDCWIEGYNSKEIY